MAKVRRKLGFDIDGTLYPWHEIVLEDMIEKGYIPAGTSLDGFFNATYGILNRWHPDIQRSIVTSERYYAKSYIRPGAISTLKYLKRSWEIFYITSRPASTTDITKAWVRSYNLPDRENVYVVDGGKRDIIQLLDIYIFVEDKISSVRELHDICAIILLTRPWNEGYNIDNHVRIDHLKELIPLLEENNDNYR